MENKRMKHGLFFVKEGMTRIIQNDKFVPVTVLSLVKSERLERKPYKKLSLLVHHGSKINKPLGGTLKKFEKEIQKGSIKCVDLYDDLSNEDMKSDVNVNCVTIGEFVDAIGVSKGHGFSGRMKRWNHKGGAASHGNSLTHRCGGSTGGFQNRSKTRPGVQMAGRYGFDRVTTQNLKVLDILDDLVLVNGSVPGPKKSLLYLRRAIKK